MVSALELLSILSGVLAALFLFLASETFPWLERTWKGETEPEKKHERRQRLLARLGLGFLGLAFLLQLAVWVLTHCI
jgi:hypothetical protein